MGTILPWAKPRRNTPSESQVIEKSVTERIHGIRTAIIAVTCEINPEEEKIRNRIGSIHYIQR